MSKLTKILDRVMQAMEIARFLEQLIKGDGLGPKRKAMGTILMGLARTSEEPDDSAILEAAVQSLKATGELQ